MLIGLYWLVPESVRWLIGAGKIKEAKKIIEKVSQGNGRQVPVHLFEKSSNDDSGLETIKHGEATVLDLFRPTKMALRTLNMCFQVTITLLTSVNYSIPSGSVLQCVIMVCHLPPQASPVMPSQTFS